MEYISQFLGNIRVWLFEHQKEVILGIILFLVASISFALGYLANREFERAPIVIEKAQDTP